MNKTIDDRRTNKATPWGFVVFTDSFMSGWGGAENGRSLFALAVFDHNEAEKVLESGRQRTDMKRGRIVSDLKGLRCSVKTGDHLAIVDRGTASRWYEEGFNN